MRFRPSFTRDFLFTVPEPEHLLETDLTIRSTVRDINTFFQATKATQRTLLTSWNVPVPATFTTKIDSETAHTGGNRYVVRRNRHWKGQFYRITDDPTDFIEGEEYISELFPKTREYRIIYIMGTPVLTLRKKVPEGTGADLPWNHEQGASFQTINDVEGSRPAGLGVFNTLAGVPLLQQAHIVGVDVMLNKNGWRVLEFNSSPALTLENNIAKVAEFIRSR
jgi:hypothetical protein